MIKEIIKKMEKKAKIKKIAEEVLNNLSKNCNIEILSKIKSAGINRILGDNYFYYKIKNPIKNKNDYEKYLKCFLKNFKNYKIYDIIDNFSDDYAGIQFTVDYSGVVFYVKLFPKNLNVNDKEANLAIDFNKFLKRTKG